jgi:hypothetical protein
VSIAEEIIGILSEICLVILVLVLASEGKIFEKAGFKSTSSKVREGATVSMILRFFGMTSDEFLDEKGLAN